MADEFCFARFHIVGRARQEYLLGLGWGGQRCARARRSDLLQLLSQLVGEIDNTGKIRGLFQIAQTQRSYHTARIIIPGPEPKADQVGKLRRLELSINVAAVNDKNAALGDTVSGKPEKGVALPGAPLRGDIA